MKLLKGIQVFLLSVVSLFVSGQYIWANADEKMHKAKKMLKSASIALNEFNCNVSNKDIKSHSESDNDGIKIDRSWDGEYNHNYDVPNVLDNSEHTVNKVLICRDVNMNENFKFSDIKDILVIKGNLGGGNNLHFEGGDDIIAISGDVSGNVSNVSINGGNGVDVLMLVKGLDSYTFNNFTNNNGIVSAQIIDKDTGNTITVNNIEGLRFENAKLIPTSDPQSAISQGDSILKLNLNGAGLKDILSNIQVLKQNGTVLFKYNDNIYDTVVINTDSNNALVLLGERSLGLLWKEK